MGATGTPIRLTRKQAAIYISERYFPCSAGALAKFAWEGSGPPYLCRKGKGHALYRVADLDVWAGDFLKAPRRAKQKKRAA